MAFKTKYIDNRVVVNGDTESKLQLHNFFDLAQYIGQVFGYIVSNYPVFIPSFSSNGVSSKSNTIAGFYPILAQEVYTAGTQGAIDTTTFLTVIETDGTDKNFILAGLTEKEKGQLKKIVLSVDGGGDAIITSASAFLSGDTIATFTDADNYILLIWTGTEWSVIENSGVTLT